MAPMTQPTRRWRAAPIARLLSLTPFALALYANTLGRPIFQPLYTKPPEMIGLPVGVVLQIVFLALAAVGAIIVWRAKSPTMSSFALLLCTPISLLGLIFSPAIVLIMQNLGA